MNYYKCKYFNIRELVSPAVYQAFGDKAWILFDPNLLAVQDRLRERFGVCIINNWAAGGNYSQRGLRHPLDMRILQKQGIWKPFSLHNYGRALDSHFLNATVDEVRNHILNNRSLYPEIKGIELRVNWLHIDTRNSYALITF